MKKIINHPATKLAGLVAINIATVVVAQVVAKKVVDLIED